MLESYVSCNTGQLVTYSYDNSDGVLALMCVGTFSEGASLPFPFYFLLPQWSLLVKEKDLLLLEQVLYL